MEKKLLQFEGWDIVLKKSISLRAMIVLFLGIYSLAILLFVFLAQTFFLDDFYAFHKEKEMQKVAAEVIKHLGKSDFEETIYRQSTQKEVCIYVVSEDAEIRSARNKNHCVLYNLRYDQIQDLLQGVVENKGKKLYRDYSLHLAGSEEQKTAVYGQLAAGKHLVLVSSLMDPLGSTLATLRDQFWVVSIVVFSMTFVLGYHLSKYFARPLQNLAKETKKLPAGKYDAKAVTTQVEELAKLNMSLQAANGQIQQADRAKKELLANVSHDLRTPLTMIMGYAEMIRDYPQEDNRQSAEIIHSEALRLNNLVNDLLSMSMAEQMEDTLQMEKQSLSYLLQEVAKQYQFYVKEEKVILHVDILPDIHATFDARRLKQVLYNFLYNAISHNPKPNKEVTLRLCEEEKDYMISVTDNGEGIPPEKMPFVWERFYQVENEHQRAKFGSGIGLNVAKKWLQAQGFPYGVDSQIGKFTTFWFKIPK